MLLSWISTVQRVSSVGPRKDSFVFLIWTRPYQLSSSAELLKPLVSAIPPQLHGVGDRINPTLLPPFFLITDRMERSVVRDANALWLSRRATLFQEIRCP